MKPSGVSPKKLSPQLPPTIPPSPQRWSRSTPVARDQSSTPSRQPSASLSPTIPTYHAAKAKFAPKKNLRLVEVIDSRNPGRIRPAADEASAAPQKWVQKNISGGMLMQDADIRPLQDADLKVVTKRPPTPEETRALLFAWKVCKHVKSNAIVYARDGQTVGVGAGQMSRVDAAKIGAMKAQLPLHGTVAASDAFFPFPDGVEEIAKAGATAIIQPGGSQRDPEVIEAADRLGLAMLFTGVRHFRH